MAKIDPIHDFVVLKPVANEKVLASGIVIPDSIKEKPEQAEVVAVGPGVFDKGVFKPTVVKSGQTVIFVKGSGMEVEVNKEKFLILHETEIIGIIK